MKLNLRSLQNADQWRDIHVGLPRFDIAAMRAATQEDLLRLPGIGKAKAAALQEKLAKLTG